MRGELLRIFLRVIAQSLSANCPGVARVGKAALHIGAVAFIHRFGSSLNEHGALGLDNALPTQAEPAQPVPSKRPAHYPWAVLIARIYEVFPLLCPIRGGQMRIIAFITNSADIRQILDHIGLETEPPHIAPARGPPLWDGCDAQVDGGMQSEPHWATDWDLVAQPAPDHEVDQRVKW